MDMPTEQQQDTTFNFNSGNLIAFLFKHRKLLITVTLVAAVASSIVSLLIENKYKSTVILFPTTTNSISKALIAENFGGKDDILELGEEEEAEQMLQVLNSDEIKNRIIAKYNLMQHYDIDMEDKYKYTKLTKKYESNISFKRTEFMSVRIDVLDHSPDTAALIANDIAALVDTVRNSMQLKIAHEALSIVQDEYFGMMHSMKLLEDSLDKIRTYGVHDPEAQSEVLTQQLAEAFIQGKTNAIKVIEEKLDVLAKYGGAYSSIRDNFEWDRKQLSFLKAKYAEAKIDAERSLEHKFIVSNAVPAEKKTYPIRWLIVVTSCVATFLFTIISLLVFNGFKELRRLEKTAA
jgi:uncharacterized protein involved in exopolysaccharide biosynthesis